MAQNLLCTMGHCVICSCYCPQRRIWLNAMALLRRFWFHTMGQGAESDPMCIHVHLLCIIHVHVTVYLHSHLTTYMIMYPNAQGSTEMALYTHGHESMCMLQGTNVQNLVIHYGPQHRSWLCPMDHSEEFSNAPWPMAQTHKSIH